MHQRSQRRGRYLLFYFILFFYFFFWSLYFSSRLRLARLLKFWYDFLGIGGDVWRWLCMHMQRKISSHVDGGQAEGLASADQGARTPNLFRPLFLTFIFLRGMFPQMYFHRQFILPFKVTIFSLIFDFLVLACVFSIQSCFHIVFHNGGMCMDRCYFHVNF